MKALFSDIQSLVIGQRQDYPAHFKGFVWRRFTIACGVAIIIATTKRAGPKDLL